MHRLKNPKNVIIATTVEELIKGEIDVCLIPKLKIDKTFSNQQSQGNGYKMIRRDKDKFREGLIFYIY